MFFFFLFSVFVLTQNFEKLSKTSLLAQGPNVCLISFVAWHGVTSVSWCGIGWDTQSRLKVVAAGRDPWLQSGLDFGTAEIQNLLYIIYIDDKHQSRQLRVNLLVSPQSLRVLCKLL